IIMLCQEIELHKIPVSSINETLIQSDNTINRQIFIFPDTLTPIYTPGINKISSQPDDNSTTSNKVNVIGMPLTIILFIAKFIIPPVTFVSALIIFFYFVLNCSATSIVKMIVLAIVPGLFTIAFCLSY